MTNGREIIYLLALLVPFHDVLGLSNIFHSIMISDYHGLLLGFMKEVTN